MTSTTALAPSLTSCGCGLARRTRTGKRCATRTQLSDRSTYGNGARQIDALLVEYSPADPLDGALERLTAFDHGVGGHAIADGDGLELGLAKVGDRVPGFGIDEREQRLRRDDHLT